MSPHLRNLKWSPFHLAAAFLFLRARTHPYWSRNNQVPVSPEPVVKARVPFSEINSFGAVADVALLMWAAMTRYGTFVAVPPRVPRMSIVPVVTEALLKVPKAIFMEPMSAWPRI